MIARHSVLVCSVLLPLVAFGCSSKNSNATSFANPDDTSAGTGNGGTPNGGGAIGGASNGGASTGGSAAGNTSAGGTSAAGASAGGSAAGSTSAGGTSAAGASAGGTSAAGASAGGTSAAGASAGGASSGGSSSAGAAGMAGAMPTTGCNATTWPPAGPNSPQMIDVTDNKGAVLSRQFYVSLPANYDSTKTYPLVTAWHYAGGTAAQLISASFGGAFYGVQKGFPNAIYVAGQGLTDAQSMMTGWPNTNGQDIAFAKAMLSWLESSYCIDQNRVMATGMSYGGIMSDALGCQMPNVFRAVGVMSGALFNFGGSSCVSHPIAAWITHGTADMTVDISGDETARDQFLKDNGCGATTQPVDPSPCVSYDGCTSGYPVVWCPVDGEGHTIPSFAAGAIANFFKQF